jgi:MerR family transcriptional regulator, light-induced transcriptional regulator
LSTYSIKDLEHLSGIKAHTLRIWEQRYNFINPKRTETNIRFYDDQDLKLILNVSLLKDNGHKISRIAQMSYNEMQEEVIKFSEKNLRYPDKIHSLTLAMIDLDEDRFEKIMANNILMLGFENTIINIIYPFLSKIGVLWQTGSINPAHEHFITNLVRQKLIVAIDGQFLPKSKSTKKYILFLPEGEYHEIGLLFASYLIRNREHQVVYLGQSLPFSDLKAVYALHHPDFLLTLMTTFPIQEELQLYVDNLSKEFKQSKILLAGYQIANNYIKIPENAMILQTITDLIEFIEENNC